MRIGYSFWGFLGHGVTETPDGGRSHRRILVDGIRSLGHDLVFLQHNRDLNEAGTTITSGYRWDGGLPDLDALFLEWRWPIPGRNDTPCDAPGHTCDLHRQNDLVRHYTLGNNVPTIIWDKDQQLPPDDPICHHPAVTMCEPALYPKASRTRLLFPVADHALAEADPAGLAKLRRDLPLAYAGNQYDRDDAFTTFFAPAAASLPHIVAGKWRTPERWPQVTFTGRIPFPDVEALYRRALATVLLAPDRYAETGQFTQRIFEAVLAGCLPVTPSTMRGAGEVIPRELIVASGIELAGRIRRIAAIAGTDAHAALIDQCVDLLAPFRLSVQLDTVAVLLSTGPLPQEDGVAHSQPLG